MTGKRDFVRGAAILSISGLLVKLLGAALRIPLTNKLGDGMAYYNVAYSIYSIFLVLSTAGTPVAISRLVSERMAVGNLHSAHRVFSTAVKLMWAIGIASFSICFFGRTAAKLDDVVNYIPARISAALMIAAAYGPGKQFSGKDALRIFKRDRYKHASPNSAQTEAACAGALHLRLAGDASYFGKIVKKPFIGDDLRPVEAEDIVRVNVLLYRSAVIGEILCLLALLVVTLF